MVKTYDGHKSSANLKQKDGIWRYVSDGDSNEEKKYILEKNIIFSSMKTTVKSRYLDSAKALGITIFHEIIGFCFKIRQINAKENKNCGKTEILK